MKFLIEETEKGQDAYETLLVNDPSLFSVLGSELALKILGELGKSPSCPMDLARRLDENEQKIYYHMRKLEKLDLIGVERLEKRRGAVAKIYSPTTSVVSFKLFDSEPISDVGTRAREIKFLEPFMLEGRLNSLVVVGSPDPHGKYRAAASDGYGAIVLTAFLGQFLQELPPVVYKLDTQVVEEDREKNLILIGGAKTNTLVHEMNEHLPIYFDYSEELLEWNIVSSLSRAVYREKQVGLVARISSPFREGREVLVLAGKGFRGTMAAITALVKHMDEIMQGNSVNRKVIARVARGIDVDADGLIDDVEFLE